jgi:hypothetical protein
VKPQAGDIGFGIIGGGVGGFVALGQLMLGDSCRYTHTFVVTPGDTVIEAMPRSARKALLDGRDVPGQYRYARLPLTGVQRWDFIDAAAVYVGVGYGFSTYMYLAGKQWGLPNRLMRRYVSTNKRMICSQLIDQALTDAGYQLFDDGRIPQDVTPGDLFYGLQERGAHFFDWKAGEL